MAGRSPQRHGPPQRAHGQPESRSVKRRPGLPPHVAEVLELQRLAGNAAVSSVLAPPARSDETVPVQRLFGWLFGKKKKPKNVKPKKAKNKSGRGASSKTPKTPKKAEAPKIVEHLKGDEVDFFIAETPFLQTYINPDVEAKGHVSVHKADEFVELATQYLEKAGEPEPEKWANMINGWAAEGEIHILETGGDQGTAIHEGIHLHQHPKFKKTCGWPANEGATEYFARMVCEHNGVPRGTAFYKNEFGSISSLADVVTEATLANAFFKGDVEPLKAAVDAKGDDHFEQWVAAMKKKDFMYAWSWL